MQCMLPLWLLTHHRTVHDFHRAKNEVSHLSATNPVEDRAKCRMCMTFGSILYRIGGEQSMKCQIHFSPCIHRKTTCDGCCLRRSLFFRLWAGNTLCPCTQAIEQPRYELGYAWLRLQSKCCLLIFSLVWNVSTINRVYCSEQRPSTTFTTSWLCGLVGQNLT